DAARDHSWRAPLIANLALFGLLALATPLLNTPSPDSPPWGLASLWAAGVGLMSAFLLLAAAPASWLGRFIGREWPALALAAGAAAMIVVAFVLSRQSWNMLSEATFQFSAAILRLYESDVVVEPARRVLGAGGFKVSIAAACSGYEGVGMVATFLSVYLWIFRRELKFPNAWLLLPIGVVAIWVLNGVRIAFLVTLGAHVSKDIAVTGFHSQAGWMMFLIVTIGLMIASHRSSFFHRQAGVAPDKSAGALAVALLAPFLATTAAGIVAEAFSGAGQPLYGLKVFAGGAALCLCWRAYRRADWTPSLEGIVIGLAVGAAWIVTDPHRGEISQTKAWLDGLAPGVALLWIAARLIGTILIAPLAEEFAFRGYLHRKLLARHVEDAPAAQFSWLVFLASSALFGALHERWLAGALAGAAFALALYRSGKLGGAVAAHVTANALIALWALAASQWTLL
ncbi:MAG: exosortase E/protease, VPEID-CTERM system, partial [Amphiplicatus sp.]